MLAVLSDVWSLLLWFLCVDSQPDTFPFLFGLECVKRISGGYCGGVPPLPIPNREVKPACADGTAMQCGRGGGRLFSSVSPGSSNVSGTLFFVVSGSETLSMLVI